MINEQSGEELIDSYSVSKIDSSTPISVQSIVSSKSSTSVTISATCQDNESGIRYIKYAKNGVYSKNFAENPAWNSDNSESQMKEKYSKGFIFSGLLANTNYKFKVKCVNGAGLETEADVTMVDTNGNVVTEIKTEKYELPIIKPADTNSSQEWATEKTYEIIYPYNSSDGYTHKLVIGEVDAILVSGTGSNLKKGQVLKANTEYNITSKSIKIKYTSCGDSGTHFIAKYIVNSTKESIPTPEKAHSVYGIDSSKPIINVSKLDSSELKNGWYSNYVILAELQNKVFSGIKTIYSKTCLGNKCTKVTDGEKNNGNNVITKTLSSQKEKQYICYQFESKSGVLSDIICSEGVYVDSNKPKNITVEVKSKTESSIDLGFSAVDDHSGIESYKVYYKATNVAAYTLAGTFKATQSSYKISGLDPKLSYNYYVVASDKVGNEVQSGVGSVSLCSWEYLTTKVPTSTKYYTSLVYSTYDTYKNLYTSFPIMLAKGTTITAQYVDYTISSTSAGAKIANYLDWGTASINTRTTEYGYVNSNITNYKFTSCYVNTAYWNNTESLIVGKDKEPKSVETDKYDKTDKEWDEDGTFTSLKLTRKTYRTYTTTVFYRYDATTNNATSWLDFFTAKFSTYISSSYYDRMAYNVTDKRQYKYSGGTTVAANDILISKYTWLENIKFTATNDPDNCGYYKTSTGKSYYKTSEVTKTSTTGSSIYYSTKTIASICH